MEYSIIVPSRNEGANVELLVERIDRALAQYKDYEIVFVDDSTDDTPDRLENISRSKAHIRYLHRTGPNNSLSTAILDGFRLAEGRWFIVMDADMQHPPEVLPILLSHIALGGADIIIPSRFVPGGSDGGLNPWRRFVSWTARMMARVGIRKIFSVKDPTSGFFAVSRDTAFSQPLNPIGWKILMELLARSDYGQVKEFPYSFVSRELGSSKFGLKEQLNYLVHLIRLIKDSESDFRFWKFAIVGLSGVGINSLFYILFVALGSPITAAFIGASMLAMFNNFLWNNFFTWKHAKSDYLYYRIFKFFAVSVSGLCISSLTVAAVHGIVNFHYLIAGIIGIITSTAWNFYLHNKWTFHRTQT